MRLESSGYPGSPGGRPRDDLREQAILDAALELLVEVGYDRLSIDAIAARAHAGKATFYRRWSDKAEVVAEAIRRRSACIATAAPDTGSLRGDLLAQVSWVCAEMSADEGAIVAGVVHAMRSDRQLAALVQGQLLANKLETGRAIGRRAVGRHEIDPDAPFESLLEVMSSMVLMRLLITGEPFDADFATHLVDDILLPLVGARSPGGAPPAELPARAWRRTVVANPVAGDGSER